MTDLQKILEVIIKSNEEYSKVNGERDQNGKPKNYKIEFEGRGIVMHFDKDQNFNYITC